MIKTSSFQEQPSSRQKSIEAIVAILSTLVKRECDIGYFEYLQVLMSNFLFLYLVEGVRRGHAGRPNHMSGSFSEKDQVHLRCQVPTTICKTQRYLLCNNYSPRKLCRLKGERGPLPCLEARLGNSH